MVGLEHDAAFDERSLAELFEDARQEPVEDEELPITSEVELRTGRGAAQSRFESVLERFGSLIAGRHGRAGWSRRRLRLSSLRAK